MHSFTEEQLDQAVMELRDWNCGKIHLTINNAVSRIAIFGSYARGESGADSDIDILVEFSRPIGLDFVTLADELESMLRRKVDLVPANAVKPKKMEHSREDIVYV